MITIKIINDYNNIIINSNFLSNIKNLIITNVFASII